MTSIRERLTELRKACPALSSSSAEARNALLEEIARGLEADRKEIFSANEKDLENAKDLSQAVRSRLKFNEDKLQSVTDSLRDVASLEDPVGKVLMREELDSGLLLEKISVPIGVIGMIFEARPDALVQIASLCLKSGNCLVLKGGKEACLTNRALYESIVRSSLKCGFGGWIELLETHEDVNQMLKSEGLIDLLIPRGSNAFVRYVMQNTTIPVLGHADGLCTMYIDRDADFSKAVTCALDAKTNYPGACNSIENMLVHADIAPAFVPLMIQAFEKAGVAVMGDEKCRQYAPCTPATDADWDTEYLDLKISIKVVDSIEQAVSFIAQHTSHHTDAIITENRTAERYFMEHVDSASVFCNCSTRFADGFRFGLGAEVGISTSKIHARGPVGLEGLMTTRFLLQGNAHTAGTYMGKDARQFTHRMLETGGPSQILKG